MKVLVTGGAGFIGHHLVRGLLQRGHDVVVLDDFSTGQAARLSEFQRDISVITGSLLDPVALASSLHGVDAVLHQAAIASVAHSLTAPRLTNEVNVGGTIDLILAAAAAGVRRIAIAGSSAVYGNPAVLPCREDQVPDPQSPYGASKLAGEHYLHSLGRLHGIETVALRYFNVFGPGQDPASEYSAVIPRFVTALLDGRQPTIFGSGEISRDFIYVDNVVDANLLAIGDGAPTGITCNIGSGQRTSLTGLLDAVARCVGVPIEPHFGPARDGDVAHSQADISLAEAELGFRVTVPFEEGIARTVEWFRGSRVPEQ